MREAAGQRRIGVVHDQRERLRPGGRVFPLQRRRRVLHARIARELRWDVARVLRRRPLLSQSRSSVSLSDKFLAAADNLLAPSLNGGASIPQPVRFLIARR